MSTAAPRQSASSPASSPATALWASAAILAALLIVQAGKTLPGPSLALAEMVATRDGFTAMTTTSSGTEELLYLLDERDEKLLVYRVQNNRRIEQLANIDVRRMFLDAAGGR